MARLNSKIHEVIVSTLDQSGEAHLAPMGIYEVNNHFLIKPFKPSTTYDNLKRERQCAINFTDDVRVFAGALTGHREWKCSPCNAINGQFLSSALSHCETEIIDFDDADPRATFTAKIVFEQTHAPFRGFNRAQSAVIEAAILVSRLNMLSVDKIRQEMAYLNIAIEKTAGSRELEAWQWLINKIEGVGLKIDD